MKQTMDEFNLTGYVLRHIDDLGLSLTLEDDNDGGQLRSEKQRFQNFILVFNKMDQVSKDNNTKLKMLTEQCDVTACLISCETSEGLDDFVAELKEKVEHL